MLKIDLSKTVVFSENLAHAHLNFPYFSSKSHKIPYFSSPHAEKGRISTHVGHCATLGRFVDSSSWDASLYTLLIVCWCCRWTARPSTSCRWLTSAGRTRWAVIGWRPSRDPILPSDWSRAPSCSAGRATTMCPSQPSPVSGSSWRVSNRAVNEPSQSFTMPRKAPIMAFFFAESAYVHFRN